MIIKAVLFDLDGVLVDACDWHYDALNRALKKVMGFEISREEHLTTYNGLPTAVKLKMLNITDNKAIFVEELKQKYTLDIIKENATIMLEKYYDVYVLDYLKQIWLDEKSEHNVINLLGGEWLVSGVSLGVHDSVFRQSLSLTREILM